MKKALITGITGQDGSYLAEFLLEKGYEVHGITRRASISNTARIDHLIAKNAITLHDGDLSDSSSALYSRMKSITWLHSPMYRFLLTYRSIPATWTRSACCGFWRQSAFSG